MLEGENLNLRKQIKELELLITKNANLIANVEKYDNRIDRLNIDLTKQIRDVNERAELNLNEATKRTKLEIEATRKTVAEIFQFTEELEPIRTELRANKAEDTRLARLIEELKVKIQEVGRFDEDYRRSLNLLEENRRQEAKRLTDLQGEVASVRKRLEETAAVSTASATVSALWIPASQNYKLLKKIASKPNPFSSRKSTILWSKRTKPLPPGKSALLKSIK